MKTTLNSPPRNKFVVNMAAPIIIHTIGGGRPLFINTNTHAGEFTMWGLDGVCEDLSMDALLSRGTRCTTRAIGD